MLRVAINGYGRIGRCVLRALHERGDADRIQVVAINEPQDLASMAYLSQFDSTHGRFPGQVKEDGTALSVNGRRIRVFHATEPEDVDWAALRIDLLLECSGSFGDRTTAERYQAAGCPRLLLSQPMNTREDTDITVVMGVNEEAIPAAARLVSNASCTTNCVVPLLQLLHRALGVEAAGISTLHSAMNDQPLLDGYHRSDLRRTRSAMHSVIPVSTELARGVERLLPELEGRIHARHLRVPTMNVSVMELNLLLARDTDEAEVNAILKAGCNRVLGWTDLPHASCDFNHDTRSSIVDLTQTRVSGGRLLTVMAWFDNEWAFACRMLEVADRWAARFQH
ncbi:erythrose-4-phosphate dehydrogenase [Methylonatrum kenyense]|uniref:type I glyceraldehyde-3-phosphate dehydrogenase n=1 Tax=Methylonatrum kenyense TaxID=455253 RepID=UPI0020BFB4A1|nr:glyceraldehyde 3-phosphate dehydrogenase NAD-binding domain-containing protein [Methylonatrum kenyense]MCK8516623.1 erythrose-4-phosphate dehydrogenase [Methylonatrum kenyense]